MYHNILEHCTKYLNASNYMHLVAVMHGENNMQFVGIFDTAEKASVATKKVNSFIANHGGSDYDYEVYNISFEVNRLAFCELEEYL